MFDVFTPVKGLIKLESICIDNNVFRLHFLAKGIATMAQTTIAIPTIIAAICSSKDSSASRNNVTVFPIKIG